MFELGYFIGKLGRTRVCALQKGDVEIPSDFLGVPAIRIGKPDWQNELQRELRAAGLNIA